ncbi:Receptor-type guanylate cyclase gcy [Seminavis robusta]|uniref:Receptor-type guanylate cyclase gcy n=1 Tax=Seminavis robusta TaxID=568900 RepID=A0A9N8H6F7_9STRA|nr:Receptor-type guanylate cyclase gcy [Seminavis robusta]|eukprot:Sro170_g075320.1 Receptor-type guanylate cyclase gcy (822) ;mRNA; f:10376-13326
MMEEALSKTLSSDGNMKEDVPKDEESHDGDSAGESRMTGTGHGVEAEQQRLRKEAAQNLAASETKTVCMLRFLVMALLVTGTTVVLVGVYLFSSQAEQKDFEDGFNIHASQLIESFGFAVERKMVAIGVLATSLTSYAQATGAEFPFVTLPDFAARGADIRVLAGVVGMHYCPMVTDEKRLKWEEYAFMHRFQINENFAQDNFLREEQDDYFDSILYGTNISGDNPNRRLQKGGGPEDNPNILKDGTGFNLRIHNPTGQPEINGTGPYFPSWQRTPVSAGLQRGINLNLAKANPYGGIDLVGELLKNPKIIISRMAVPVPKFIQVFTANLRVSQYRKRVDTYLEDPFAFFAYPVFDSLNVTTRSLAGMINSNLYWRVYFQDVLPSNAQGIIAVLSNSYNQTFSYRIDGQSAVLLGPEDFHDPHYSDMVVSLDVTSFVKQKANPETRAYLTAPLHETFGRYTLKVYPTDSTKDEYTTSNPVLYTVVVGCIFAITALVFVLFDTWVEKRQRIVLNRAVESGAIVNELFPEEVQHRMYEDDRKLEDKKASGGVWRTSPNQAHGLESVGAGESGLASSGGQIADEYKNCTVIFSDLAGFTARQTGHCPSEVFELLETIYKAIDSIALRRKVFKVETIGDCWLGVCGLPQANPKHAMVMARFAADCQKKMQELVVSLSDRLGSDTESLRLRTGLHSGSVTAGVLRGQKSRFQLFGDTVNTASRIETTGQKGRIHASQTTADELIAFGKRSWLIARSDKVVAKGKGEMQTYWIEVSSDAKSSGTMSIFDGEGSDSLRNGAAQKRNVIVTAENSNAHNDNEEIPDISV